MKDKSVLFEKGGLGGVYLDKARAPAVTRYVWDGVPDGVPADFIERCVYEVGGVGICSAEPLNNMPVPMRPGLIDLYGQVTEWTVVPVNSTTKMPYDLGKQNGPAFLGVPEETRDGLTPYINLMTETLDSIRTNVMAMRTPILVDGVMAGDIKTMAIAKGVEGGEVTIPIIGGMGGKLSAIDLGAKDFINSLIAAYDKVETEYLDVLGINNSGTEKASGVTVEETESVTEELSVRLWDGLKRRIDFCKRVEKETELELGVEVNALLI